MRIRTKFQKQAVDTFLRCAADVIYHQRYQMGAGKKQKDQAREMLLGMEMLCEDAGVKELFETIKKEKNLCAV